MNCKVCKKTFTGIECLKQHEASKKHLNKIKLLQITPLEDKKPPSKSFIYCSTCDETFSDIQHFQKHAESFEHIQMALKTSEESIRSIPCSDNLQNTSSVNKAKKEITMFNVKASSTISISDFKCELCNKYFTGAIPYHQHLQGAIHKKKSTISECKDVPDAVSSYHFCKTCSKEFNGPVPYSIHLESKVHREKEVELQKIESMNMNMTKKWYCEICKKQCSGFIPYEQHLSSKVHFKNLNKNEFKVNPKSSQKRLSNEESNITEALTSADSTSNDEVNAPPLQKRLKLFHSEEDCNYSINEHKIAEKKPLQKSELIPLSVPERCLFLVPERDPLVAPERDPLLAPERDPLLAPERDPLLAPERDPLPGHARFPFPVFKRDLEPERDPIPPPERDPLPGPARFPFPVFKRDLEPERDPIPAPERDPLPGPARFPFPVFKRDLEPERDPIPAPEGDPIPAPEGNPLPAPEGNPLPAPEGNPLPTPENGPAVPSYRVSVKSVKRTLVPIPAGTIPTGRTIKVEQHTKPESEGSGSIYRISVTVPRRTSEVLQYLNDNSSSSFKTEEESSDGCCCGDSPEPGSP